MTIQELEAGKKLFDAIKANERVLEHFKSKEADPDKIGILVNFFTNCNNLHASSSKKELAQFLYDMLVSSIEASIDLDKKALSVL